MKEKTKGICVVCGREANIHPDSDPQECRQCIQEDVIEAQLKRLQTKDRKHYRHSYK